MNNEINSINPNSADLACYFIQKGYSVLPVNPHNKKPNSGYEWKNNPINEIEIAKSQWAVSHKGCAVGIITGEKSNLLVLDIDNKNGKDGSKSLSELEDKYGKLPDTFTVKSPTGGYHYYFDYNNCNLTVDADVFDGLDYRGNGGYVLSPGSVSETGVYEVVNNAPVAPLPKWLNDVLKSSTANVSKSDNQNSGFLTEGSRNTSLASMAGYMFSRGHSYEEVETHLMATNAATLNPLPEQEVISVVQSIHGYHNSNLEIYATEQDFAEAVAVKWKDKVIYVSGLGFLICENHIWNRDGEDLLTHRKLQEIVNKACEDLDNIGNGQDANKRKQINAIKKRLKKRSFQNNCLECLKSNTGILTNISDLDGSVPIVGLNNGVFDLTNLQIVKNAAELKVTKNLDVTYDPDAQCPLFDSMMDRIFPDKSLQDYVMTTLAYSLSGDANQQQFYIWVGKGANGKSTLLEIISEIFGNYSVTLDPQSFMRKPAGSISSDVARLRGARLCVTSETPAGAVMEVALVKRLSGNDTIVARELYKADIQFQNKAVIFMPTNFIPVFDGGDGGIARRVKIVPFDVIIPEDERDPNLLSKLKLEKSGIFNRLLKAYQEYKANGIVEPDKVKQSSRKFTDQSNLLKQFVEDELINEDGAEVKRSEMYQAYKSWATARGYKALSDNIFSTSFENQTGLSKKRKSDGYVWENVKFKSPRHGGWLL